MSRQYTAKEIEQIMLLAQGVISLNTPIHKNGELIDGTESEIGDMIVDPNPTPDEEAVITDRKRVIAAYLERYLTPREQRVIRMRFGFETGTPATLEDTGAELGITRERARQIEVKAISKLRRCFMRNKITRENI